MLWEPQIEGRNTHSTLYDVYFKDPFLAYAYLASTPFFLALGQGFKVLGYIGRNRAFSRSTVNALRSIKRCAFALIGFAAGAQLLLLSSPSDDRAGGVFIGILIAFGSLVLAAAAAILERVFDSASALDDAHVEQP